MVTIDTARTQSSEEVVRGVTQLAAEGRAVTADLIALLAVLDERRLFETEGCGSLFEFCLTRLRLSESQAYHRIQAARAAARFPVILERLRDGSVTLTSVALLRPVLTEENHARLLSEAAGRTKREVECLVRALAPRPDVPVSVRKMPASSIARGAPAAASDYARIALPSTEQETPHSRETSLLSAGVPTPAVARPGPAEGPTLVTSASCAALAMPVPARPAEIRPLAPTRYSLRVTISEPTHAKLRRCQDLLGHAVPDGDVAAILDRALTVLLAQLERRKFAARTERPAHGQASRRGRRPRSSRTTSTTPKPEPSQGVAEPAPPAVPSPRSPGSPGARPRRRSRHIPAAVRRAVWARDEGRCSYVGHRGRCAQTRRLEFHHRVPFADGGAATVDNLTLRCRRHNGTEARRWFGEKGRDHADSDRSEFGPQAGP